MARDLNKVMIIGRLGRDPEMRFTSGGKPVTTFSMAAGRSWTTRDGQRRSATEWFNIVAWGSLAEVCNQYLTKGQRIYIEGRLQTRRWDDANGSRRSTTEVVANEMIILSPKNPRPEGEEGFDLDEDVDFNSDLAEEEDEFPF